MAGDKEIRSYFPERGLLDRKLPPRDFFWKVMQTLRPDYCEQLIKEAQHTRSAMRRRVPQANTILNVGVTKEMASLLLQEPFSSRKCPRVGDHLTWLGLLAAADHHGEVPASLVWLRPEAMR